MVIAIIMFGTILQTLGEDTLAPPSEAFDDEGNPVSNMKSLNVVEPRQPIQSLPCIITNPGAYYLTKNMSGSSSNVGIQIECGDVQIDLNGFALIGATDSGDGIRVIGTNENISIRNGSVREWSGFGINAPGADDGTVQDIKANRNGFGGIRFGVGAMITACSAFGNGYKAPLPPSYNEPTVADSDYDGMDDCFEQIIIDADPNDVINTVDDVQSYDDYDGDGASNWQEFSQNTSPVDSSNANSDGDGMDDNWEMQIVTNNPTDSITNVMDVLEYDDYDSDGSGNFFEFMNGTDPTDPDDLDSDQDGMRDVFEMMIISVEGSNLYTSVYDIYGYDDYDQDGASNWGEYDAGTDPTDSMDFPPIYGTQEEYAGYTNPPSGPMYDNFVDPTDEPQDDGIRAGGYATIKECKARGNRGSGIYAEYGSRVVDSISAGNDTDGIHVTDYCNVLNCTAARNRKDGITVGSKCRVQNNNCGQNGDYAMMNSMAPMGAGIRILGNGNRVEDNNVSGNALGIEVDDAYNMQYGGTAGMSGGGNLIIGNSCVDNWGKAFDLSNGDYMGGQMYEYDVSNPANATNAMMDAGNPFSNFNF